MHVTCAIALLGIFAAPAVPAAVIDVNTTDDVVNDSDGLCSLREALTAPNTISTSGPEDGECPAGTVEGNTINLPAGTYTLTIEGVGDDLNESSDLDIEGASLSIVGAGAGAIIDADGIDRVFDIQDEPDIVVFQNLTIRGGNADGGFIRGSGAGIATKVPVSLVDVVVEDNEGLGVGATAATIASVYGESGQRLRKDRHGYKPAGSLIGSALILDSVQETNFYSSEGGDRKFHH